jgi:hypothetical protein
VAEDELADPRALGDAGLPGQAGREFAEAFQLT